MSLTLGSQTPGQLGGLARVDRSIPPAFSRRRGRARRRGSGTSLRRPFGRRRPRERSPRARASSGTRGRLRGRRSSPEQSSGRRPEFGNLRPRRCGARQWRRRVPTGSWRHQEHGDARGRDRLGLVPPWRHGRRRGAYGRGGELARRGKRTRGGGGSVRGLTAELASARARSGMPGSSRIAGEDPRRLESNLATATAPRGTPACVARRGGSWRRGGAPGDDGEARERRWLR